jgi:hypothetical protein
VFLTVCVHKRLKSFVGLSQFCGVLKAVSIFSLTVVARSPEERTRITILFLHSTVFLEALVVVWLVIELPVLSEP